MKKRTQVIIPMGGEGSRFLAAGYTLPKPLLDIAGTPLIEKLLKQFPHDCQFIFIVNEDHLKRFPLEKTLKSLCPEARIIPIPAHKKGPVYSVLQGISAIDATLPCIVNYCDFSFSWDFDRFIEFTERTHCDGAIISYRGEHPHYQSNTLYAYSREEGGRVLEIKEKGHFTPDRTQEYASSGTYYFASGALLRTYFERAIQEGLVLNGEFYISLVYNPMIQDGKKVLIYEIDFFLQWGTPNDLEDYLYWHRVFDFWGRFQNDEISDSLQVVIPMAGLGSRFRDSQLPKPFIQVLGTPMHQTALRFLPRSQQDPILIYRTEFKKFIDQKQTHIVLDSATQGQADTTRQAMPRLNQKHPVLVSACDHGLLWDPTAWSKLLQQNPDVVIFAQRGSPGARRTPQAFSYVSVDDQHRITGVSVKKPFTQTPQQEFVLVGTFYFRTAEIMNTLIDKLIQRDIRVNGERYLDSIVTIGLEEKMDVRCFETAGYLNWGTPEALSEFSYWHHYFFGVPA